MKETNQTGFSQLGLNIIIVISVVVLLLGAYVHYRIETSRIREKAHQQIAAIGKLKVSQIVQWRQERLADARAVARGPLFKKLLEEWIQGHTDPSVKADLVERLQVARQSSGYTECLVLTPDGHMIVSTNFDSSPLDSIEEETVRESIAKGSPMLSELFKNRHGIAMMDAVAPIYGSSGKLLAVAVLRAPAGPLLHPLVNSWPTPSETAETLLVRKEKDHVVFLNELRHQTDTALTLLRPLTKTSLPAVQAALGKVGVFEGSDYRGVDVVADLQPIPDSSWFMVAKIDTDEILAEARYRGAVVAVFSVICVLLGGSIIAYVYRNRQTALYRDLYQSEKQQRETQEMFRTTLYSMADGIITTDTNGMIQNMNAPAERLTGWLESEAIGKHLENVLSLVSEQSREVVHIPLQAMLRNENIVEQPSPILLIPKDGRERSISYTGAPIRVDAGRIIGLVLILHDQTAERRAQKRLEESEERLRSLIEHLPQRIFLKDRNSVYLSCNNNYASDLGATPQQIVGRDDYTFHHPDLAEAYRSDDRDCMETGMVKEIEESYQIDGQERWAHTIKVPYRDRKGQIIGVLGIYEDVTERRETERELHRQKELLERILQHVPLMVAFLDKESRHQWVNRAWEQTLGWRLDEVYGRRLLAELFPDAKYRKYANEFVSPAPGAWSEFLVRTRDGRLVDSLTAKVQEPDGSMIVIALDITDKKRSEEELRKSEERFRQVADSTGDWIWEVDEQGIFTYCTPASERILGYSVDELVGKKFFYDLFAPGLDEELEQTVLGSLQKKEAFRNFVVPHIRKDGVTVIMESSGSPMLDGEGALLGYRGSSSDVTERIQGQETRTRLTAAIEQTAEGIVIMDPQGKIDYVNSGYENITGYSRDEAIGMRHHLFECENRHEQLHSPIQETLLKGSSWASRIERTRKDGTPYVEDIRLSPVVNTAGKIVNYVAIKRDVSLEVNMQRQVLQSQKMEAVGTLAGGIAHDFNNILQVVSGYSELMLATMDKTAKNFVDLEKIHGASKRGADLVQNLMMFSRKVDPNFKPLNLNDEVAQIQKLLSRTIPKNIRMTAHLSGDLNLVEADISQMGQVLMNLAVNARDAMPDGGDLNFETSNVDLDEGYCAIYEDLQPGAYVLLTVSDTGIGMNKETLSHMFEPFFTTKGPGHGTGLGLATVFGIVKQHQGYIACESELGKGASFKIYLPAVQQDRTWGRRPVSWRSL